LTGLSPKRQQINFFDAESDGALLKAIELSVEYLQESPLCRVSSYIQTLFSGISVSGHSSILRVCKNASFHIPGHTGSGPSSASVRGSSSMLAQACCFKIAAALHPSSGIFFVGSRICGFFVTIQGDAVCVMGPVSGNMLAILRVLWYDSV
jgi:hypothetical protein